MLILALAGAVDSGYLLIQTVRNRAVICPNISIGRFNLNRCNVVLSTPYSKFLGLPVALYGLTAYLFFAILTLYEIYGGFKNARFILSILSGIGFMISTRFVYLQFFTIKAVCFYCLISSALITLIFILSATYNIKYSSGD